MNTLNSVRLNRRRLAGALALSPWLLALPVAAATPPVVSRRVLMGTQVAITLSDAGRGSAASAMAAAWDEMSRLAAMMSRWDPASSVSVLNRSAGHRRAAVPAEMLQVLRSAQRVSGLTGGAFDITVGRLTAGPGGLAAQEVPDDDLVATALRHVGARHLVLDVDARSAFIDDPFTRIDLGGIAKLPILQAGIDVLAAHGVQGALVNGGGDVVASARSDGRPWRVGLRDPLQPDRLLAVLPLGSGVVASSGDYERFVMHRGRRYHHIVDPATGRPTQGLSGVTLVDARAEAVNGLGTAAMVAGPAAAAQMLGRCGVQQWLLVASDGTTTVAPVLASRLQAVPHVAGGGALG